MAISYLKKGGPVPPSAGTIGCTLLVILVVVSSGLMASPALNDTDKHQRVMAMYTDYRESFPEVADIDADRAIGLLSKQEVVFVDVRDPEEQAVSMIPDAITADTLMDQLENYRNERIIVYCTISYRSGKLAAKLKKRGYAVLNLEAGLLGWVHAGGPLVQQGKPVKRLHVYGRKWDLAPAAIETVY